MQGGGCGNVDADFAQGDFRGVLEVYTSVHLEQMRGDGGAEDGDVEEEKSLGWIYRGWGMMMKGDEISA